MGTFFYIIPSAPGDKGCIIFIDLLLPMGWVDSPDFFCTFLEMLTYVANALVNTDLQVPSYSAIFEIPATGSSPPHNPESLPYIDCYIYDIILAV